MLPVHCLIGTLKYVNDEPVSNCEKMRRKTGHFSAAALNNPVTCTPLAILMFILDQECESQREVMNWRW